MSRRRNDNDYALDRVEKTGKERVRHLREIVKLHRQIARLRFSVIDRRLQEQNNAHALAVVEKQRTDERAVKIQETMLTKDDFRKFERDIRHELDVNAGAVAAKAKSWAIAIAAGTSIIVGVTVGLILFALTRR